MLGSQRRARKQVGHSRGVKLDPADIDSVGARVDRVIRIGLIGACHATSCQSDKDDRIAQRAPCVLVARKSKESVVGDGADGARRSIELRYAVSRPAYICVSAVIVARCSGVASPVVLPRSRDHLILPTDSPRLTMNYLHQRSNRPRSGFPPAVRGSPSRPSTPARSSRSEKRRKQ